MMNQGGCTDLEWRGVWSPFVRVSYQFGMLLGVDELNQELGYHLCKHRLSQRLFVGYGLVWGAPGYSVDATSHTLTIGPLFALDELGRELWVKGPCTIDLAQWLADNSVAPGTTIHVTIAYRACSAAPVPAVAAPCDNAASPTMPSRVIETAVGQLSIDAPPPPLDLATKAAPPDRSSQASRFATLVRLISEDADRPLLLGTIEPGATDPTTRKPSKYTSTPNAGLPRLPMVGGGRRPARSRKRS